MISMYTWYDELISYSTGTGLMEPKCEQYWPTQEEKKKELGQMEISWKGKAETRKDFTHQWFEVRKKSEGMLGHTIWAAPTKLFYGCKLQINA